MKITVAEITKYLAMLDEFPHSMVAMTASLSEAQARWSLSKKDWSIIEVLTHLRACSEIWSFTIYAMLTAEKPVLPLLDERRWTKAARYASLDFQPALQVFVLKRHELLLVLRELDQESWGRSANIEGRNHTVFSQARRMALHDAEHLGQIESLVKGLPT